MYTQESREEALTPMLLRVLMSLSNQCLGLSYIPYRGLLEDPESIRLAEWAADGRFDGGGFIIW